ncbi:hypothetical protein BDP27DRAFT_1542172 [Rhodocollybia butyracea]|uniref:Uncharacterized protein n=1 Tax=Rhodocollybia butyracea TaxID=206335 RepID=A0A9P5PNX9_9AGAR|nr:hypothetical protein BDP27DRAFT_1542172 [Rhodocollybia butyracea]
MFGLRPGRLILLFSANRTLDKHDHRSAQNYLIYLIADLSNQKLLSSEGLEKYYEDELGSEEEAEESSGKYGCLGGGATSTNSYDGIGELVLRVWDGKTTKMLLARILFSSTSIAIYHIKYFIAPFLCWPYSFYRGANGPTKPSQLYYGFKLQVQVLGLHILLDPRDRVLVDDVAQLPAPTAWKAEAKFNEEKTVLVYSQRRMKKRSVWSTVAFTLQVVAEKRKKNARSTPAPSIWYTLTVAQSSNSSIHEDFSQRSLDPPQVLMGTMVSVNWVPSTFLAMISMAQVSPTLQVHASASRVTSKGAHLNAELNQFARSSASFEEVQGVISCKA